MQVSVVLLTYNHEPFVARAIEGVLAQVGLEFELVVTEDCSTDRTRAVVDSYAAGEPSRMRVLSSPRNLGMTHALARGIHAARAPYVAVLDGDDYWTSPDKLRRQVEHLDRQPDCTLCFHDALEVREDGSAPPRRMNAVPIPPEADNAAILERNSIPLCSTVFRRSAIAPLPPWYVELPIGDLPLYLLAAAAGRIEYLDEVMAVYRVHGAGAWSGLDALERDRVFGRTCDRLSLETAGAFDETLRRIRRARWQRFALAHARAGDARTARHFGWQLLRTATRGELARGGASLLGNLARGEIRAIRRRLAARHR